MENQEPRERCTQSLELVRRAQGGEFTALNTLLERYYERVRRIVRMRLGQNLRGHLDSGDILQETFIAAVGNFDRFEMREESSLIQWLSKIAENQIKAAADFHFAQKRDKHQEVALQFVRSAQESGELIYEPSVDGKLPLDDLVIAEDIGTIEVCMAELREEYLEVILLRNYTEASWEAISEEIDSPSPAAARMLHARAITELARLVRKRADP